MRSATRRILVLAAAATVAGLGSSRGASAATDTWTGLGTDSNWKTPSNWLGGTIPVAGDSLVFDGALRLSNTNNYTAGTAFAGLSFASTAEGPFTLSGNQITLNGNISDNTAAITHTIALPLLLGATPTIDVVSNGSLTISGAITGGSGLNKTSAGLLTLSGSNAFTGPVAISGGTVSVSSDANLGSATSNISIGGGATLLASASFTLSATRAVALGPGTATVNVVQGGLFNIDTYTTAFTGANTLVYGGVMSDNGGAAGLTKIGYGGISLGGANTYSGTTTIRTGTVRLDFSAGSAPASNILYNGLGTPGALVLGGAVTSNVGSQPMSALVLSGKASAGTNSQAFSSTSVAVGKSYVRANSATGNTVNLELGALTHSTGGIVNFIPPASGAMHTSSVNDASGIIGGWALMSNTTTNVTQNSVLANTFASVDGSGNIVGYTGYTAYTLANNTADLNLHDASFAGKNVMVVGGAAATHTPISVQVDAPNAGTVTDVNTISFQGATADGDTVFIGQGNTLRLGQYGAIFRQDTANSFNTYIGGATDVPQTGSGTNPSQDIGTLTAGGADNTPGEIHFIANSTNNNTGRMIVGAKITDNGTGAVTVIKSGSMGIKIDGHNTYTGGTYILEGIIQLAGTEISTPASVNADGLGTGNVYVMPGAQFFANAATFANNFFVAGIGTNQENFGVIRGTTNTILTGVWTFTGDTRLGARGASGNGTQFQNKLTDNGNGFTVTFGDGGATGIITVANSNTTTADGGTRTISTNDWAGNTVVGFGQLFLGLDEQIPDGVGKGNVQLNSSGTAGNLSVFELNGHNETINGLTVIGNSSNNNIFVQNSAASTTATLTVGNNDQTSTFRGVVRDNGGILALTKRGVGLLTLSGANAYTGNTNVNNGTLALTGSMSGSSSIFVNTSATAAGTLAGKIPVGNVTLAADTGSQRASVDPGDGTTGSVGTLNVGTLTVGGGDLHFDLFNSAVPSSNDKIAASGAASFTGPSTVSPSATGQAGSYSVVSASSISGTLPTLNTPVGARSTFSYDPASWDPTSNPGATNIIVKVIGGPASLIWKGTVDGTTWDVNTTKNWLNDGTAGGVAGADFFFNGDAVTFNDTAAPNYTIAVATTVIPGAMLFTNVTGGYTINGPGGIAGAGSITKSGAGLLTITNTNTFSGGTTINGGTVTLSGNGAGGTGLVTVNSGGTLNLNASNAAGSGGVLLNGGLVNVGAAGGLGSGTLNLAAGSLDNTSGGALTVSPAVPQIWSGNFTFTGTNSLNLGTGAVTLSTSPAVTVSANTLTVGGIISDGGSALGLQKVGAGTLVLNGVNTFTGGTTVSAGTLQIGGAGALASTTVNVSPGATLTISGTLPGTPNLNNDGTTTITAARTINTLSGAGTLNLGNTLTTNNGGPYSGNIANNGANVGSITVAGGALTLSGNSTYSGNTIVNAGMFLNINSPTALGTSKLTLNANTTIDNVSAGPIALTTSNQQVWAGDFNFSGTNSLDLGNGAVALDADTTISANASTLTVGGAIANGAAGTNLTKAGSGILALSGVSTFTGNTTVNAGTLNLTAAGGLASPNVNVNSGAIANIDGTLAATATVNAGGTTNFGGSTTAAVLNRPLAALNISSGVTASITASMFPFTPAVLQPAAHSFADPTAKLNITNNEAILNEAMATTVGRITSNQIFSTSVGGAIGSLALSPTQTEVRYTLLGDTNLDGKVDVTDLGNLASSYGTPSGATWVQGDTNYSGAVDVTDLGNLASNYGGQLAAGPSAGDGELNATSLALVAGGSSVPEPASLALAMLGAASLLTRRRRR